MIRNTAPLYENGYIQIDDKGSVVLSSNDVQSEMLERLRARSGTNLYDPTYGSELYLMLNSRNLSSGQVNSWVRDALLPMVTNGRLLNDIVSFSIIAGSFVKINISATSANGEQVTAVFSSLLLA